MVSGTRHGRFRAIGEKGSASIMLLSLGIAVVLVAMGVSMAGTDLVNVRRATQVADLAALAAAKKILLGEAVACEAATVVATANRAELQGCRADDLDVVVGIRLPNSPLAQLMGNTTAVARAGPVLERDETAAS